MPSKLTDSNHLRTHTYRDPSRLNARIALHERFSSNPTPWHRWVFDQLEIPAEARILEVGCGPGEFWEENLECIPADANIVLTDLSHGMALAARTQLGHSIFAYSCANAQTLPYPAASFDLAIANHMLYHLADRQQAYKEFARVLKLGGKLYAATNGQTHLKELAGLIHGFNAEIDYAGLNLGFNLEYGQEELATCFNKIKLRQYADALEVTEGQPLAAYIASMSFFTEESFDGARFADLTNYLQSIIERQGRIHITKSVGLFVAHKH
jgi:ubiquinone/menaquinone biosynthesis C-methylase UbiE